MKNIVIVYLGKKGGASVYSYEMAKALIDKGVGVHIFISKYVENIEQWKKLKCNSIEFIKTYNSKIGYFFRNIIFRFIDYYKLKRKYSNVEVDACYAPMVHFWTKHIFKMFRKSKKIITIHDPIYHSSNNKLYWNYINHLEKKVWTSKRNKPDEIVILSKKFIDIVSDLYKIDSNHIHVIPHGIFDYYKNNYSNSYYQYNKNNLVNFLFFGRISAYKGIDDLLRAYQIVCKELKNVSLTIVGSGDLSYYSDLISTCENINIINEWIPDEKVNSYFDPNANVILVLPYKDATQSGVIPIALCSGVPVIATNTGGLSEQIIDGVTGYLTEPNNFNMLAKIMLETSKLDNSTIIENGRNAISELTWDKICLKLLDLF